MIAAQTTIEHRVLGNRFPIALKFKQIFELICTLFQLIRAQLNKIYLLFAHVRMQFIKILLVYYYFIAYYIERIPLKSNCYFF